MSNPPSQSAELERRIFKTYRRRGAWIGLVVLGVVCSEF